MYRNINKYLKHLPASCMANSFSEKLVKGKCPLLADASPEEYGLTGILLTFLNTLNNIIFDKTSYNNLIKYVHNF